MIMSIISAILSRWQIALGVVALLIASHGTAYCSGQKHGKERAEAEQAALQAKALEQARKADYIASEAAKETTSNVEAGNQRAREANRGDALADGFNSLRRETGAGAATPATR